MHDRGNSVVFVCPNGVERGDVVRRECDAGICDVTVDVCNLKVHIESVVRNKCNARTI